MIEKRSKVDFRLNAIVDGSLRDRGNLADLAALAARNGATLIQYRDKEASTRDLIGEALAIRAALAGTGAPLIVNDRVDVALAVGAAGVHLGREDMDPAMARRILGPDALIGATVKNAADAEAALAAPVDYVCVGGVFATLSKRNPDPPLGLEGFARLRALFAEARPELPVGAIAGIDAARAGEVLRAGASGVAVISGIFRAPEIAAAAARMRRIVDQALAERGS
ncbi:thiamine phosphate synthase [Neomegalonema perideroedes]|uniref:thiamine phosphate synthase n=1 Tax=Neomegalonema perideroedes TaxID=217219 RepID=UPI00037436D6|nr:thiamine phosphate synthase [Neomegalonema perideroedes]